MRAYEVPVGGGGVEALALVERDEPRPGPTGVLIAVRACSLNHRDQNVLKAGRHVGGPLEKPTIPMSDGAGEVIEAGAEVTRVKVGDRVAGCFFQNWFSGPYTPDVRGRELGGGMDGMLAERVVLDQAGVVKIPDHLTYEEAATLPCAPLTAWHGLFVRGHLAPGQSILVLGTGGVSIFALQIAKATGARVAITSSSDQKLARARELGADWTVNYKTHPEWDAEIQRLCGGVDHVIEVGGAETLPRSVSSLRNGGQIYQIGFVTGWETKLVLPELVAKYGTLAGVYVGSRAMFEDMNAAIEVNNIKPVVDRVFPFDDAKAAYAYHASGAHFGKVVMALPG
jgi:NADPH:quinone reductase-like Zn-dependent oxidoreductase